jgi:putative sigma-54 modulation protein
MIEPIDIVGQKFELDEDIKRYVRKKIGRLDRYLSRHARKSVKAEVKLRDIGKNHGNKYECEVILYLPAETIMSKDSTLNVFAAVDIVEAKLKNQLKKYKDIRTSRRSGIKEALGRRFWARREEQVEGPIEE